MGEIRARGQMSQFQMIQTVPLIWLLGLTPKVRVAISFSYDYLLINIQNSYSKDPDRSSSQIGYASLLMVLQQIPLSLSISKTQWIKVLSLLCLKLARGIWNGNAQTRNSLLMILCCANRNIYAIKREL